VRRGFRARERARKGTTSRNRHISWESAQNIGRATIYKEADGRLLLRLTNFKTSNGPDVHVVLIAAKDADDDANFLKSSTEKLELGSLKGNEGDQNYNIHSGTDLKKFQTVSIYCERFNANFGAAPLEKF
jgi:Electron transfer DM13